MTFSILAKKYIAAGCPDKQGVKRPPLNAAAETRRIENLRKHFRGIPIENLSIRNCAEYGAMNQHRQRSADLDLQVLSNLCWFAVAEGVLTVNPVLRRAKTRKSRDVVHCRESMPKDADELHRIARDMLEDPQSQASGFQLLFECFTGLRTSEALALRTDATAKGQPGFVENDWLYVRRSKSGGTPYIRIDKDLEALLMAHDAWKAERFPDSPWYFPGKWGALPLGRTALTIRLARTCKRMGLGRITSHGCRAFFVTVNRSRGIPDTQIAAMVGNTTVSLIQSTYGDLPLSWSGGESLSFMPKTGKPAWETLDAQEKEAA